jgi:hypothetical protein
MCNRLRQSVGPQCQLRVTPCRPDGALHSGLHGSGSTKVGPVVAQPVCKAAKLCRVCCDGLAEKAGDGAKVLHTYLLVRVILHGHILNQVSWWLLCVALQCCDDPDQVKEQP